jgi:hypothetical protein
MPHGNIKTQPKQSVKEGTNTQRQVRGMHICIDVGSLRRAYLARRGASAKGVARGVRHRLRRRSSGCEGHRAGSEDVGKTAVRFVFN